MRNTRNRLSSKKSQKGKNLSKDSRHDQNLEVLVKNKRIVIINRKILFYFFLFSILLGVVYCIDFINKKRIHWSGQQIVLDLIPITKKEEKPFLIETSGWEIFTNQEHGWEIKHPGTVTALSGEQKEKIISLSGISLCNPDLTVGCFYYRGDEYRQSNFETAGVSVELLVDKKTEEDCLGSFKESGQILGEVFINGVNFTLKSADEFITDYEKESRLHRTFYRGKCFEIDSKIITNISASSQERKKALSSADKNFLRSLLRSIVFTFKFIDF